MYGRKLPATASLIQLDQHKVSHLVTERVNVYVHQKVLLPELRFRYEQGIGSVAIFVSHMSCGFGPQDRDPPAFVTPSVNARLCSASRTLLTHSLQ